MHVHGQSTSAVSRPDGSSSSTPFDLVRLLLAAAALLKLQTVADHSSQDGQLAAIGLSEMRRQLLLLRIGRAVSVSLLLVLSTALMIQGAMASATHFGLSGVGARSDLVVLEPDDWVGHRFPLLSHIDVGETLASGEWTVVLYHSECSRCRAELRAIHEQASAADADPAVRRIALVELPPHGASLPGDHGGRVPIVVARYAAETDWFGELPITVQLSDGVVLSAGH